MRKKRLMVSVLAALLLFVLLAGCGPAAREEVIPDPGPEEGMFPLTFVDDAGKSMEIRAEPERIVSLMPSLTETVFALGIGDRLVGVSEFCNYPQQALQVEKIGSLSGLNTEKILALEPDLILAGESEALADAILFLEENGLTVVTINPQDLDAIEESFRRIGEITGVPREGEDLAAQVRADRDALAARVAATPEGERPKVFILLDSEALWTMGTGVFLSDMVAAAGGINAAADQGEGYFQISEETLFTLDPDVIINTWPMKDAVMAKTAWQDLQSVRNDRVYDVDGDLVTRPGPRIIKGLEALYSVFYK